MSILQSGFDSALQYVDRLVARFTEVFDKTGSLGQGLGAVWDSIWPDLKRGAAQFAAWLAGVIKEALLLAWSGFWKASPGAKAAVGGVGALMLAPTVMSTLAALPALGKFGGAALGLGKAGWGAAMAGIGSRGAALGMGIENIVTTSTGGIVSGAGTYSSMAGGSGMLGILSGATSAGTVATIAAVALPLVAAYVVGKIGAWGIGKWGEASSNAMLQGNAGWGTRLLSRVTGAGIDVDRSNAGARAGQDLQGMVQKRNAAWADVEQTITAALQAGAAAWARLLQIQERMTANFERTGKVIQDYAEGYFAKVRTPEQSLDALREKLSGAQAQGTEARLRLNSLGDRAGGMSPVAAAEQEAKLKDSGLRALEEEARITYEILGLEAEKLKTIRDQNMAYGEQMANLSYADRARAYALQKQVGGLSGQDLINATRGMSDSEMRLLTMNPEIKKSLSSAFAAEGVSQGLLTPADQAGAMKACEDAAAELERKRQAFGPRTPEQMEGAQNRVIKQTQAALGELNVKVTSDDVKLVISADSSDKALEAIQQVMDRHAEDVGNAVSTALKSPAYQDEIQRRTLAELRGEHVNAEAEVPG